MSPESPEDRCATVNAGSRLEWVESGDRYTVVADVGDEYVTQRDGSKYQGRIAKRSVREGMARLIEDIPAPATAESPWATVDRLRADLALRTEQFVALGKELTEAKAQLGRAVELLRQVARFPHIATDPDAVNAFLTSLAPSQPEPVKAHAFDPLSTNPLTCRTCFEYFDSPNQTHESREPVTDHAFVPYWRNDGTRGEGCRFFRPEPDGFCGRCRAEHIPGKAGIIKPPCEYCHDEGGKPECYGCKKVMP